MVARTSSLVSVALQPAARAVETAQGLDPAPEVLPELYGGASVMDVLECAGWPRAEGAVILVGHQPLGERSRRTS